jgi:hypothetical protein
MKLNTAQIEQTLNQFEAEAIPSDHPVMPQLQRLFGDHTYFLDGSGLNIVEPVETETEQKDGRLGVVINLADWSDVSATSLQPHAPESTEVTVALEPDGSH